MKIAVVHSFYSSRQSSGENTVLEQQVSTLKDAGHEVAIWAQHTDLLERRRLYPIEAAWRVATGHGPSPATDGFEPDIVHVHNLFPNLGSKWLRHVRSPVVSTLHNYRTICSNGVFYRDGAVCMECFNRRKAIPAIVHGCYRGRTQSVPVALGRRFERDEVLTDSDALIVLSDQMRDIFAKLGVAEDRLHTIPHFLPDNLVPAIGKGGGDFWLYAGRLSPEKGILAAVEHWPSDRKLLVVGSGPDEDAIKLAATGKLIDVLGHIDRSALLDLMRSATGLIFPSRCFETFGLSYMEAISAGTPVIAFRPSVVSTFIERDGTGLVSDLAHLDSAVKEAESIFPGMRSRCRAVFSANYSEKSWLDKTISLYRSLL